MQEHVPFAAYLVVLASLLWFVMRRGHERAGTEGGLGGLGALRPGQLRKRTGRFKCRQT